MKIGVVFPQTEIGNDPAAIQDYAQAVGDDQGPLAPGPDARLNPLPVQRPIPIWMGGESERAVRRAARVADGWMPHFHPGAEAQAVVVRADGWFKEAGRDPSKFGVEGRFSLTQVSRDL
jgi:alkanesulfonate monooxygenase SsuD/methylene tetrahydromethanopterin reductase-like flavin-dependent oxidoreductase (luciferase family)